VKALKWTIGACITFILINVVYLFTSSNTDYHIERIVTFTVVLVPLLGIYLFIVGVAALARGLSRSGGNR
jgi:hypothetical protein